MVLAIVQVIEGKNFPCDGREIQFKATWGKDQEAELEAVSSDSSKLIINQEVAFNIVEEEFNSSESGFIIIECTASCFDSTYIRLGLLEIPLEFNTEPVEKWFKLKNGSTQLKDVPSVLLRTYCELTEKETVTRSEQDNDAFLKPVLINDEYFLIKGPGEEEGDQIFHRLAVTLSFAENLLDAFPSRSLWPPENVPFEFRFNLMGSPIHFQPFNCLSNLTEIGERATAKIKCSAKSLLRFLKESMQTLTMSLYCEDIPIARCVIPIKERIESCRLESQILNRLYLEPVEITGIFPIRSSLETESIDANHGLIRHQIGVAISLAQIDQVERQPNDHNSPHTTQNAPASTVSPARPDWESLSLPSKRHEQVKVQEDLLYATALELEVWKEEQKLLEQGKQERSRASYMELLNSEYRRQAALKEGALQRRIRHVEELEKQLEQVIQAARQSELELQLEKERCAKQRAQLMREKKTVDSELERVTLSLTNKHKFELEAERRRHTEIVNDLRRKLKAEGEKSASYCETIKKLEARLLNTNLT